MLLFAYPRDLEREIGTAFVLACFTKDHLGQFAVVYVATCQRGLAEVG
jgi:hypothetical protein